MNVEASKGETANQTRLYVRGRVLNEMKFEVRLYEKCMLKKVKENCA
jgi:hypothetical protein